MVESLGEKLRSAREEKELSLDQASRETNISIRFLKGLEAENFTDFPAEAYVTGFIRNYGGYLDLDVKDLLSLYKAYRIQEQPVPMEKLLKPQSRLPKFVIFPVVILLVLGAAGAALYFFFLDFLESEGVTIIRVSTEHTLEGSSMERRLFTDDVVVVPTAMEDFRVQLANLGETVALRTGDNTVVLDLGQEATLDLEDGSFTYLHVRAVDFVRNNPSMGVLLHFNIINSVEPGDLAQLASVPFAGGVAAPGFAATNVLFSSPNPFPFTLQANFTGFNMFRWEILFERDRRERNERHFQSADELIIQAQNGIRIWTSNAQAARFQVIGGGRN
ncbi:MAG: helix-turn-helix domain-containing protein, partial [Spirochaetes bacterium]|nr:helix-turn-helix domain-containing protein [Spirochaetota bacterium]